MSSLSAHLQLLHGPPFNHPQVLTDIVLLVILWRLRYKLSLRDLAEMFRTRGFSFTHETVREWEARFAPLLTERLRAKHRGKAGTKWQCDETYVKVGGRWRYLYRVIDADGNLINSMLSGTRDTNEAPELLDLMTAATDAMRHVVLDKMRAFGSLRR